MGNEEFRRKLIGLLRTSKIYYVTKEKEIQRVYTKNEKDAEIKAKNEMYSLLMNMEALNTIMYGPEHVQIPISKLMNDELHELQELCHKDALEFSYEDTLEEVAQKLGEIGKNDLSEEEQDEKAFDDTLLYRLRRCESAEEKYQIMKEVK